MNSSRWTDKNRYLISWDHGTADLGMVRCQHTDFSEVMGGADFRKRTVTCNDCGRTETSLPYARRIR